MDKPLLDPVRDEIVEVILKQVMEALLSKLPFLSWGPAGWVATKLMNWLVNFLLDKTILGVNLLLIKIENDGDVEEFNEALEKVQNAPENEKEKYRQEVIDAARNLIKLKPNSRL
jgi:hypothetical protein